MVILIKFVFFSFFLKFVLFAMEFRNPVPQFMCTAADPSTLASNWERWKRSIELYFAAEEITDASKKVSKLLFYGGLDLQDVYYNNLPKVGTANSSSATTDVYKVLIDQLDGYFMPKANPTYERYVFGKIVQETNETSEAFLTRLKKQVKKCDYGNKEDEMIVDAVIRGCRADELRRKLLEKSSPKLSEVENLSRMFESVSIQLQTMKPNVETKAVNALQQTSGKKKGDNRTNKNQQQKNKPGTSNRKNSYQNGSSSDARNVSGNAKSKFYCYRCGNIGHFGKDNSCPAKNSVCRKCNLVGHWDKVCKTSADRVKQTREQPKNISMVTETERVFSLSACCGNEKIDCVIGGVNHDMFIDSGADFTGTGPKGWNELVDKGVKFSNKRKCSMEIQNWGNDPRLKALFVVDVKIEYREREITTKLVVLNRDGPTVLGKFDAMKLHVLILGDEAAKKLSSINSLQTKPLAKLKDFQLILPIDKSVTPVTQPF